jgi:membrane fusion protein, multidrug efflux system
MYSTQRSRLKAGLIATTFLVLASGGVLAQAGGAMPPPAVGVIQLQARPVPVVNELPGRIAATRTAEVRARVSGILQERVFQQGSRVKQGDVLFRIEPRLFRVASTAPRHRCKRPRRSRPTPASSSSARRPSGSGP